MSMKKHEDSQKKQPKKGFAAAAASRLRHFTLIELLVVI